MPPLYLRNAFFLSRKPGPLQTDEGEGAVQEAINAAVKRLIAFEIQLGPFAVAQLRILAEIVDLTGGPPTTPVRMFVTDTLGDPYDDAEWLPTFAAPIGKSRKDANKIKRDEPITVVIGNPPYKERAKGRGGWIESGNKNKAQAPPLSDWMPPTDWGAGVHSKHLRNLYVYFWRWATWKVYDHHPASKTGIVCFITVAGFLGGPGFQKMRDYLRRTCDDLWIIDCSPDGHQAEINTRIFQGVQQPVCIVLASKSSANEIDVAARARFTSLPSGHRSTKFSALAELRLNSACWIDCPTDWRAPFFPSSKGDWATYPALEQLFVYNGSGVMPGRTWIIAPDAESLAMRWKKLTEASGKEKEELFHPHLRGGKPGDKHTKRVVLNPLPGFPPHPKPIADEKGEVPAPIRYGFRSFDRQWIIPDNRLINQPNPELWRSRSANQVYLTAFSQESPVNGPALTFSALIPDLHHYKGSFGGRVFPLWQDALATISNVRPRLLDSLSTALGLDIGPQDVVAYVAGVAAHPAFTARFQPDLSTPGLRIPISADPSMFREAAEVGRRVIWLHTFGESMADSDAGRPLHPPRLPTERMPRIPKEGAIPTNQDSMPDSIGYDATKKRLLIGSGYVENVAPAMWAYEISDKQVLPQWFSYRRANRERPIIGERRKPSPLGDIQPDHWLAEYTTELINVLNVLGCLVDLEPTQASLLDRICSGPLISEEALRSSGAFEDAAKALTKAKKPTAQTTFDLGE